MTINLFDVISEYNKSKLEHQKTAIEYLGAELQTKHRPIYIKFSQLYRNTTDSVIINPFLNAFIYYTGIARQAKAFCYLQDNIEESLLDEFAVKFRDTPEYLKEPQEEKPKNTIHPQVQAFLKAIRVHEGTSGDDGYNLMFTRLTFDSFKDHPRKINCGVYNGDELCSDAAGAYQFLSTTWDIVAKQIEAKDFSPYWQDMGAIQLIKNRKAYTSVVKGDIADACDKCSFEWASMPDRNGEGRYGQPNCSFEEFVELFKKYGGVLKS